jgi:hypothetical protein
VAVVFRAATSGPITSTASPTVTAPTGLADGDVIIIGLGMNDVVTIGGSPTLNGFTSLGVVAAGTQGSGHVLWKVANGEGASWTFTNLWSAASTAAYGCVAYQDDAAGDAGLDQSASNAPASSTTPVSASITPSVDNCMVVGVFVGDHATGVTATTLGGATERVDTNNGGQGACYIEELLQTTAAAVTMSATFSSAVETSIFNLSVKPVAAGGGPPAGIKLTLMGVG